MSDRFEIRDTSIFGLKVLRRTIIEDDRGFLERLYCADELRTLIGDGDIAQINRTLTLGRGTVRGLHFQSPPYAEIKFVQCLSGTVFDVAVDARENSPTFLKWHSERLSETDHTTVLIPEGFAHGFQTLTDRAELLYFHTAVYEPSAEGGLNPRDPMLDIQWPEEIAGLSARDASHPMLTAQFRGLPV